MRKKKKKRRAQSKESLLSDDSLDSGPGTPARPAEPRLYERRGQHRPGEASSMERIIEEPPEYDGRATDTPESLQYPGVPQGYYDNTAPYQQPRQYPPQPGYYDNVPSQQQPYFYSDQPELGAYYDNVPSPASPYMPDTDGYYMRSYPHQAPSGGQSIAHQPRPGLEESEL